METMYFVLGMLSIIGAGIIATIVWGVVKISKLLRAIKNQEESIQSIERSIWDYIHRDREDLQRRLEEMDRNTHSRVSTITEELERRIGEVDRHAHDHVNELEREMDSRINNQITDSVTQCSSYTDKRIDKLVDTYLSDKKSKKELING
jgi:seryl-tRNA(Sec) selenium transferase